MPGGDGESEGGAGGVLGVAHSTCVGQLDARPVGVAVGFFIVGSFKLAVGVHEYCCASLIIFSTTGSPAHIVLSFGLNKVTKLTTFTLTVSSPVHPNASVIVTL